MFSDKNVRGVIVVDLVGYFDADCGEQLQQRCTALFREGHCRFVLDFAKCDVINSPGIGAVLDLGFKIKDDFRGKLVLASLNPTKYDVFLVVGVIPMIPTATTADEAVTLALQ